MTTTRDQMQPSPAGARCLRIGFFANLLLVAVKLAAGLVGRSQSLVADGFNSILDVVAGAISLVGYRVAAKPADEDHHYGHGNAETLAALIIGLLIIATGGIIVRDAIAALWHGNSEKPSLWTLWVAGGVIVTKLALSFYSRRIAGAERSHVVSATATDHAADVIATSGVIVGLVGAQLGYPALDPIAAFWVAAVILYHAFRIVRDNIFVLLGGAPSDEVIKSITSTLRAVPGVLGLHRTKVRTAGRRFIVDTEILLQGTLSVEDAHQISNDAADRVLAEHPQVAEVVVHVEPHSPLRAAEGENPLTPRHSPRPVRQREGTE